jgi:hypothetical protein
MCKYKKQLTVAANKHYFLQFLVPSFTLHCTKKYKVSAAQHRPNYKVERFWKGLYSKGRRDFAALCRPLRDVDVYATCNGRIVLSVSRLTDLCCNLFSQACYFCYLYLLFIFFYWQFYFYLHYQLLSTYEMLSTSSSVAFCKLLFFHLFQVEIKLSPRSLFLHFYPRIWLTETCL